MTFVDPSPALERGIGRSGGNCCVLFKKGKGDKIEQAQRDAQRRHKLNIVMVTLMGVMVCVTLVALAAVKKGNIELS